MRTLVLSLLVSGVCSATTLCAQAPEAAPSPAVAATPKESPTPGATPTAAQAAEQPKPIATPAPTEDEKALVKLEQDWGDAVVKDDAAAIDHFEAEEYAYTDPNGQLFNKHDSIEAAKSGKTKITSFKIRDLKVHVYGDTAVATGQTQLKGSNDEGDISGDFRWTDVFVRRDGRWQAVASQATAIQTGDTGASFEALPRPSSAVVSEGIAAPAFIRAVGPSAPGALPEDEKTLVKLEYDWARASAAGDTRFADRVEAAEYVFTAPDGQKRNKSQDLAFMKSNRILFDLRYVKAKIDGDTATVSGQATETEGDLSAEIRWTDRFVRRDGRWQAVSGQSKIIP